MPTTQHVYALFDDVPSALAAYKAVQAGGCATERCSAILHENHIEDSRAPAGERASREAAVGGAAIGGAVGAVLGSAAVIIGGVVAIGPLAAAALGAGILAAYGALTGGIAGADEPEKHLRALEKDVLEGKIVIALETDDPEMQKMCEAVFKRHGGHQVVV